MKAITTRYLPPTDTRGGRVVASDLDGNRIVTSYNTATRNPHVDAAIALCRKLGWTGTLQGGHTKNGMVFTWIEPADQIEVNS